MASQVNLYAPSAANAATYANNLDLRPADAELKQAPQEAAHAGGPDASILLPTIYGGSSATAKALTNAANGGTDGSGLLGNLATSTVNQIIVNTETNALAAFYHTSLSYWSRINLYAAAGYFQGGTRSLNLASTDTVKTDVTVDAGGTLGGAGAIAGECHQRRWRDQTRRCAGRADDHRRPDRIDAERTGDPPRRCDAGNRIQPTPRRRRGLVVRRS